jgi:hypothetical protein
MEQVSHVLLVIVSQPQVAHNVEQAFIQPLVQLFAQLAQLEHIAQLEQVSV